MTDLIRARYELGDLIASGGMGSVYRGWDNQNQEAVAIKVLKPVAIIDDVTPIQRFLREGMVLRQLNHPNIVKVLATTEEDGQFYLVMELVEGGTLGQYLETYGLLPIERMLEIALEITDALTRAHHINIIHRDLKPANILMDENGSPRVTDFGLAFSADLEELTASGIIMGTVPYMSPEALMGQDPDFRTDIWSLGVMFYEMLTGQRPFRGKGAGEIITKILQEPPNPELATLRPDCPPLLVDLVDSMLTKDGRRRISSMRQVGGALEALLFGHSQVMAVIQPPTAKPKLPAPQIERMLIIVMYTDIEKSTQKWEKFGDAMDAAIAQHDRLTQETVERFGGKILRHRGDGMSAVFETGEPLQCAIALQQAFAAHDWGEIGEFRIRIGLDAGQVSRHVYESGVVGQKEEYFGRPMNRAARVLDTGSGGQILLTSGVMEILDLPNEATTQDLGEHSLKDLPEPIKIYGLVHPDLPQTEFPPLKSLSSIPNNLPIMSTSFIGREREIEEILGQITQDKCRLLTILGAGGMGKTRLAIEVSQQLMSQVKDGVFWIDLAPLDNPADIPYVIAEALHISPGEGDIVEQLIKVIQNKTMVLLMDNFEHVLAGTDLVDRILAKAPKVKILVTSRTALNLDWEWRYELSGLEVDESGIRLFEERAKRVRRDFDLARELQDVVQICQMVDGMPLGIELAATWMRMLTAKELLEELDDSLDILTSQQRSTTERHRSLLAVFDYSWNLLTPREQSSLIRLSIFRESFDRTAAKVIAEASLFTLSSLVDKSLLKVDEDGRYYFHELLRQFAYKRLTDADLVAQTEDKYIAHYVDLMVSLADRITDGGLENQRSAIKTLIDETATVDYALLLAADRGDLFSIEKCFFPLHIRRWQTGASTQFIQLHHSIYNRLPSEAHDLQTPEQARAYVVLIVARTGIASGVIELKVRKPWSEVFAIVDKYQLWENPHWLAFFFIAAEAYDHEIISLEQYNEYRKLLVENRRLGKPAELGLCLYYYATSNLPNEQRLAAIQESITLLEKLDDHCFIGWNYFRLANYYAYTAYDFESAYDYLQKTQDTALKLDSHALQSAILFLNEHITAKFGHYEETIAHWNETYKFHEIHGNRAGQFFSLIHLMSFYMALGDYATANQYLTETETYATTTNSQWVLSLFAGNLATYQGKFIEAQNYLAQAAQKFEEDRDMAADTEGLLLQFRGELAFVQEHFAEAEQYFRQKISVCEAERDDNKTSIARAQIHLAETCLLRSSDDLSEVLADIVRALRRFLHIHEIPDLLQGIYVVGLYLYQIDNANAQAVAYFSLAQHHYATQFHYKERAKDQLNKLREIMSADDFEAAIEQGKNLDPYEAAQQFLDEYGLEIPVDDEVD